MTDVSRADRAALLLNDDILSDAFAAVEASCVDALAACNDRDEAYHLAARIRAVRDVRREIEAAMLNGIDDAAREERRRSVV